MADTLGDVADTWALAFRASRQALSQEVDLPRFHEAFRQLLPRLREWPAPAEILELLPPRPRQRALDVVTTLSEGERAEGVRMLREFQNLALGVSGKLAITDRDHNEASRANAHARERER